MAQTLVKCCLHFVFSTKNRKNYISKEIENRVFGYIGKVTNDLGCQTIKVGGYKNHIHLLCYMSKKISIAEFMNKVKSNSSRYIKTLDPTLGNFAWQAGYGCFSIRESDINTVQNYIQNQETHHQATSFQDEFISILDEFEVDYDPDYIWK